MSTAVRDYPKVEVNRLSKEIASLPSWMEDHTGWVIKKDREGVLVIVGRGKGNPAFAPFSSAKYRKDFGF